MAVNPSPNQNQLLAALPQEVKDRLFPHLERVLLPLGKVIYEADDTAYFVYFPTDTIISLVQVMENGAPAEIAVVGREGLAGVSVFMGGEHHQPGHRAERGPCLSNGRAPIKR